jgi:threonine dehydratase
VAGQHAVEEELRQPVHQRPGGDRPHAHIAAGVRLAAEESRLVAEPSGALAAAALRYRAAEAGLENLDGPVVAIVSGGNVDPERYREFLEAPILAPR